MGLEPGSQRFKRITRIPGRDRGYVLQDCVVAACLGAFDCNASFPMPADLAVGQLIVGGGVFRSGPSSDLHHLPGKGDVARSGDPHAIIELITVFTIPILLNSGHSKPFLGTGRHRPADRARPCCRLSDHPATIAIGIGHSARLSSSRTVALEKP